MEEAASERNLLPPEPGWDRVLSNRSSIEQFLSTCLRSGFHPSAQVETSARKARGVRPVPRWGKLERIVYRALTTAVLGSDFDFDRSPAKYVEFSTAPVTYSFNLQQERNPSPLRTFFFMDSDIDYVVKSDISAFYQYVDHAILGHELQTRGADYEAIGILLELLSEAQNKTFGLPQLLDPSDYLSEIYIDRVERQLIRQGFIAWRFNDDFRIACKNYPEALRAIEALDLAARESGLVINEFKTFTFGFRTYMDDSLRLQVQKEEGESILLDEVEAAVGDYTDDFFEDADAARQLVSEARPAEPIVGDNRLNLRNASADDVRLLRRALSALAAAEEVAVIPNTLQLIIYVPALTPTILKYLIAVSSRNESGVAEVIDSMIDSVSLNEWQGQWLMYTIHELDLLAQGSTGNRSFREGWARNLRLNASQPALKAIASHALSAAGLLSFSETMNDFEALPTPLLGYTLTSLRDSFLRDQTPENNKRIEAVARISPLHAALVKQ